MNNDGKLDLVSYEVPIPFVDSQLSIAFGDGKGGFTSDTNSYYSGNPSNAALYPGPLGPHPSPVLLTWLNNKAPLLSSDHTLDALVLTSTGLAALLNQDNAPPVKPSLVASVTVLQSSALSVQVASQVTLTASVLGVNRSGSVAFSSNGSAVGTAQLVNGSAALQISFATAGSYLLTAIYSGDANNASSVTSPVLLTVIAPDFNLSSNPTSASITAGQSATFQLTMTPVGGYTGSATFSCSSLPSEASCNFSPASITSNGGSSVTTTLTITTTASIANLYVSPKSRPRSGMAPESIGLGGVYRLSFYSQTLRRS